MSMQTPLTRYSLIFNYYFEEEPVEEFSSFGPAGSKAQIASISGINHDSIGIQYDGYGGGVSAPTLNSAVTTDLNIEVRSPQPDSDGGDDSPASKMQDGQANE